MTKTAAAGVAIVFAAGSWPGVVTPADGPALNADQACPSKHFFAVVQCTICY
ncbi:MAG: hypothetical protein H7338_24550 [Candidatus Sericytochromatia bacterium]|nr:hypothetical protein [Candidatus Sericytochromatia bacterium]